MRNLNSILWFFVNAGAVASSDLDYRVDDKVAMQSDPQSVGVCGIFAECGNDLMYCLSKT